MLDETSVERGGIMRHMRSTAVGALLFLSTSACSTDTRDPVADAPTQEPSAATSAPEPRQVTAEDYDPANFSESANVDHTWFPLRPGTRHFYKGSSLEDGERLHHTVDIIVTDLTKTIDGVRNVIVWERDYTDGELVETELALFAQDVDGNIWHMGEYPEEYEDGKFVKAPAWVHGLEGATAGITIAGAPRLGTPGYAQGYAPPPINWADRGRVYKTGHKTCVPAGCYEDVVVIEEFENALPDAFQDKYYAPQVGVVRVGWRGSKDESKEVLALVSVTSLDEAQMSEARKGALKLEARSYMISKDVFAKTAPAELSGP